MPQGLSFVKLNCGMENPANVCFANSIVQALSACPSLVFYLLSNRDELGLDEASLSFNNRLLTVLLMLNQTGQDKAHKIDDLVDELSGDGLDFSQQQDSHEFLKLLCDKFSKVELLKAQGDQSLATLSRLPTHPPQRLPFSGQLSETLVCLTCNTPGLSKLTEFLDFTFLINFTRSCTVEQLFAEYFKGELREGVNCARCSLTFFLSQLISEDQKSVETELSQLSKSDVQNFETVGSLTRIDH